MLIARLALKFPAWGVSFFLIITMAGAQPVPLPVGDADFEQVTADTHNLTFTPWFRTNGLPGRWTYGGVFDFGTLGWVPGGGGVNQVGLAAFYPEAVLHQELADSYVADTTYELSVDIVAPYLRTAPDSSFADVLYYTLNFEYGGTIPAIESDVGQLEAAFGTSTNLATLTINAPDPLIPNAAAPVVRASLSHYVAPGAPEVGQRIQISMGGAKTPGFDNVVVTADFPDTVTLTVFTSPSQVDTVTPAPGQHDYGQGQTVDLSASRYTNCPDDYLFSQWIGSGIAQPTQPTTTVLMDVSKTVTALFVPAVPECGDACHPPPESDITGDCKVNLYDFIVIAQHWLEFN